MQFVYTFPKVGQTSEGAHTLDWAGGDAYSQAHAVNVNRAIAYPMVMTGMLSAEECERVVTLGEARINAPATVDERTDLASRDYRVSDIAWIEPAADAQWLFHRLAIAFAQINASYGFELVGFAEPLQFTCYGPGQYFGWHVDIGVGDTAARKLSLTVQLSDANDYGGGELQFHGADPLPSARARGSATFFPSFLAHQVTPVTSGLRRSLVVWAYGSSFR